MQDDNQRQANKLIQTNKMRPNSRQRLKELKKEQEYLSQTFKIDNFYYNQKLDINSLKNKIHQIKRKVEQPSSTIKQNPEDASKGQKRSPLISLSYKIQQIYLSKNTKKKINSGVQTNRDINISRTNPRNSSALSNRYASGKKNRFNIYAQGQQYKTMELKTRMGFRNQKLNESNTKYHSIEYNNSHRKSKQMSDQQQNSGQLRSSFIPKIQNIGRRQNMSSGNNIEKSQSFRKTMQMSRLQPLSSFRKKLSLMKVQNLKQLAQFQSNVSSIWQIYEKLCQIVKLLSYQSKSVINDNITSQQFIRILCDYKYLVCSTRLQFLINIIDNCLEFSHAKTIILSRLLQNLSIVYIFFQIVEQALKNNNEFLSSFFVNFVGICSNNLLLILRIISLVSFIDESLTLSQGVSNIFKAILQFQVNSYRSEITSIKDAILRIEHNNQLVSIIQGKINNRMSTKEYHKGCLGKFIKGVIIDRLKQQIQVAGDRKYNQSSAYTQTKPFYQYSYFLFQYLAYHLHHQKFIGLFPKEIQTAPEPYLPLKKQFTIIIDPSKVLTYSGKSKIYVRAHSQKLLSELNQKCNIIFWSLGMPNQIDSLYDLVDIGEQNKVSTQNPVLNIKSNKNSDKIKRLYKYHSFYDYNSKGQLVMIKDINRIGCFPGKYIILDSNFDNYYSNESNNTILLPWKGEAKDGKLTIILDILLPYLREGTDLTKGMKLIKIRLQQLLKSRRQKQKQQLY